MSETHKRRLERLTSRAISNARKLASLEAQVARLEDAITILIGAAEKPEPVPDECLREDCQAHQACAGACKAPDVEARAKCWPYVGLRCPKCGDVYNKPGLCPKGCEEPTP